MEPQQSSTPKFWVSVLPVLFLMMILVFNITIYKDSAAFGPNQIGLLFAAMVAMGIGVLVYKQQYGVIEKQIIHSISLSMQAMLILLLVGSLVGVWILSGVVPFMIYYGLKIINPDIFLPVACIICCIVSVSTGSSWSTSGTVGIALMGIGHTLGVPAGMTAGAIISGAYFGDKISPLSDTTNLAPAMAGTDLFTHIRHMMYTTIPSIILAIIGFTCLGFFFQTNTVDPVKVKEVLDGISANFNLNPLLMIVPIAVIAMIIKKVPAFPALLISILISILFAIIFQQELISKFLKSIHQEWSLSGVYQVVVTVCCKGFGSEYGSSFIFKTNLAMVEKIKEIKDGIPIYEQISIIDKLFNRGGMASMLNTIWLILTAMIFGGTMEGTRMLHKIAEGIMKLVRGVGTLIGATLLSCIFMNVVACDQYLAIVIPGRMFRKSYQVFALQPKNLSRALEDSGTVTSVLIPWNSCAAYNSGVLGVATLTYLPYCFFNLLSPLISGFCAAFDITIIRMTPEEQKQAELETAKS